MKPRKDQSAAIVTLLFAVFILFFSCKKDHEGGAAGNAQTNSETIAPPNLESELGQTQFNQVQGILRDGEMPIVNATVRCGFGSESVQTDPNGFFLLSACESYDRYGFITAEAPGYFAGFRQYFPPPSGQVVLRVNMLKHAEAVSFEASSGATISSDWGTLQFAPGAFAINGLVYSGTVTAFIEHIAPSRTDLFDVIPGGLAGLDAEGVKVLETFGMLGVELFADDGQPLDVLLPAEATLYIDETQQAYAASEIDLWSLDPASGLWVDEGEALRVDNAYQMELPHFSWWNCDVPSSFVWMEGTVSRQDIPVGDALVTIYTENAGCASTLTNSSGEFAGMVPRDQELSAEVNVCLQTETPILIGEYAFGPLQDSTTIDIEVMDYENHFMEGQFVGCEGAPIELGYMLVDGEFQAFDNEGFFGFYSCLDQFEMVAYEVIPTQGVLASDTLLIDFTSADQEENLGEIMVCNESITISDSTVTDGNYEYETVVIGTKEWFAENLQTTSYANGDPIIEYMNAETWLNLSEGQYLHYDFAQENLEDHGRLYNGYAIQDPRGICPSGWHVSTAADWAELITLTEFFDMPEATVLKSSALDEPAWNGYNQLGFSATPGGRMSSEGDMNLLGSYAYYWVDSTSTAQGVGYRIMSTSMGAVGAGDFAGAMGYSVRCVRD